MLDPHVHWIDQYAFHMGWFKFRAWQFGRTKHDAKKRYYEFCVV